MNFKEICTNCEKYNNTCNGAKMDECITDKMADFQDYLYEMQREEKYAQV